MTRYAAKGVQLEVDIASSWTPVAQVFDIGGPSSRKDVREITGPHHVADGWRVFRETLRDGGDLTLELHWDPGEASHDHLTGLQSMLAATGPHDWRITFPDTGGTVCAFSASIVFHEPRAPADGKLTLFVTLKISGEPTWS